MDTFFEFEKMHGAGNDFVVVADPSGFFGRPGAGDFVRAVCAPHTGLFSEGLIALAPSPGGALAFSMAFFNPDGSRASMCGNGARCAAFFAYRRGWAGAKMRFASDAGDIGAEILSGTPGDVSAEVRIECADVRRRMGEIRPESLPGMAFTALDTGVPHAVFFFEGTSRDFRALDVDGIGRKVRFDPAFAPEGTNVDFVRVAGPAAIELRTYERGVEAETGACGTGAMASAVAAAESGRVAMPCSVAVHSGCTLSVDAAKGPDGLCSGLSLAGPARTVCEGRFAPESFA